MAIWARLAALDAAHRTPRPHLAGLKRNDDYCHGQQRDAVA
jgi:hypothetical protein